ncbi:hypothetical protein GFPCMMHI_02947 [Ensifer adhaerens]|nr:hypothetical protein [Ensifer adhaerens]
MRHFLERAAFQQEPVARHHSVARTEEIVERKPDLDEDGAAASGSGGRARQRAKGCPYAARPGEDRHECRQRFDAMRRVLQEQIALERRLRDQPEFAGFQIFQAAVNEARWRSTRSRAEIGFIDDEAVHALGAKVAKQPRAIDSSAEDDDVDISVLKSGKALFQIGGHIGHNIMVLVNGRENRSFAQPNWLSSLGRVELRDCRASARAASWRRRCP